MALFVFIKNSYALFSLAKMYKCDIALGVAQTFWYSDAEYEVKKIIRRDESLDRGTFSRRVRGLLWAGLWILNLALRIF